MIRDEMHFGYSLGFHNVFPGSIIGVTHGLSVMKGGARKIYIDLTQKRLPLKSLCQVLFPQLQLSEVLWLLSVSYITCDTIKDIF